jgi:ABC-type branched-subunit amino acid transport system substrate-binding protein
VRASVSTRYTDGVVTATPRGAGQDAGLARFVEAYEERFRRTLTETAVPAAGYDAASLLLRALESGVRGPSAVTSAVEEIDGFEGATGILSVREGRILRRHSVVCVQNAGLVDLPPGQRPVPVFRPYPPNPETGIVPEGPGRPAGFRCLGDPAEAR